MVTLILDQFTGNLNLDRAFTKFPSEPEAVVRVGTIPQLLLAFLLCLFTSQVQAQVTHLNCGPQRTITPSNIMYFASSPSGLSPSGQVLASSGVTEKTVYGVDGGLVGFALSTQSLKGVKSLSLTIPPAGLGTGTFRIDAPIKRALPCSLSLPLPPAINRINPILTLAAGGVYSVTAVGIDRTGVSSAVDVTYKVLQAELSGGAPYQLNWSSKNASRLALFVLAPDSSVLRVGGGLAASGTTGTSPGTYLLVVVSPNVSGSIPAPTLDQCKPASDTADSICRQYTVPAVTPPSGWVAANFSFTFETGMTPCSMSQSGAVVVQGSTPPNTNTPAYSFVAVMASNYTCASSTTATIAQNMIVNVPRGDYQLTAQFMGISATCTHGLNPNGATVAFNGNASQPFTLTPQGSCDMNGT